MFWFILPICKESLTSLLHIDSCWVYLILRSLTSLLYTVHVCRGSLTSPLMHCISWVMWVRAYYPFLHIMYVCREVNFASSSSWMYIAYILIIDLFDVTPLLILCFEQKGEEEFIDLFLLWPLVDDWQKGGEVFVIYACFYKRIYVYAYMF